MPARLPRFALSRAAFPAWGILGVGLLLTGLVGLSVKRSIDANAQAQFANTSNEIVKKIRERLAFYDATLQIGVGLFTGPEPVSRSNWRAYYEKLMANQLLAGTQAISVVKLIRPEELQSHISAVRAEGFPDYTVRPEGRREVYAPIVYNEPLRGRNLRALGVDVYAEPIRRAALERARDSGRSATSGKIVLYVESDKEVQAGFAIYAPIYRTGAPIATVEQRRAALIGWVNTATRMGDMMAEILRQWQNPGLRGVTMIVYDQAQPIAANTLYRSGSPTGPDPNSLFYVERKMDFNDHPWLAVFDRDPASAGVSHTPAWLVVGAGVAISVLMFFLALSYRLASANPPGASNR